MKDISVMESVQLRFTKWLPGLDVLTYQKRFRKLGVLSLELSREEADLVFIFKCMKQWQDLALEDLLPYNERSEQCRLQLIYFSNKSVASLFWHWAVREWNALPPIVTSCVSLSLFRSMVHAHFQNLDL